MSFTEFLEAMKDPKASDLVRSIKIFIRNFEEQQKKRRRRLKSESEALQEDGVMVQEFVERMEGIIYGHVLWKDIDEKHPLYDSRTSPKVKKKFNDTWKKIDTFIGELLSTLPNDTNFMIVSDHGMGPLESVFYPNTWLEMKGWLKKIP